MEKLFNEDKLSTLMEKVIMDNRSALDLGMDECCSIAESMIEEINQNSAPEFSIAASANRRLKVSLKKKLIRQIRAVRRMAML
jgi:hypothetical protein